MTDAAGRPATRRREQTRARLLEAAHDVFAEVGMDAASVELICECAGFTRGAFYSNFGSKNELFLALITDMSESKMTAVAERVRDLPGGACTDPAGLVRRVLGASFGATMTVDLLSELRAQAMRDDKLAAAYLEWQHALRRRIERIIVDVVDTHGLRLRLPVADAAELLMDLSDATCIHADMEGCSKQQVGERLSRRLEMIVAALVDAQPVSTS
ncbi:TetR/AcrR family transcriptional regulator [Microbacterium sp.]|uniref:TetR/AcrR family transcriptional regulator n=1 Tax=Microbacterium sp. TaxID=51671 RepID=UPI003A88B9A5